MTAFRILDQFPVYLDSQGNLAISGYLSFYDTGTTTPRNVYGDKALTVNNGSTIAIGADGRTINGSGVPIDVWGNGSYRVRLYASDNTLVAERDNVELPGGGGTAIPALLASKFLTNDGAVLQWTDVLQVPDPTGQSGKILGTDGTSPIWQAVSTLGIPVVSADATTAVIAGVRFQWGNATLPASGATVATVNVTFAHAFSGLPYFIGVTGKDGSGISTKGCLPILAAVSQSATGFTVSADINAASGDPPISRTTNLQYLAVGPA